MADKRISELNTITGANTADDDLLVIVDSSASETKGITLGELEKALGERDFSFADDDKLVFGDGDDLQIYHASGSSYIADVGSGALQIRGTNLILDNTDGSKRYIDCNDGSSVDLFYNNSKKLATTDTGIDVTGTVTADGLTVESGAANIGIAVSSTDANSTISFSDNTTTTAPQCGANGDNFRIITSNNPRVNVDSDGNVGIGTTDPTTALDVNGTVTADGLTLNDGTNTVDITSSGSDTRLGFIADRASSNLSAFRFQDSSGGVRLDIADGGDISFYEDTGTTPKLFWDASEESLGINQTSPNAYLHVKGASDDIATFQGSDAQLKIDNATANTMNIKSVGSGDKLSLSTTTGGGVFTTAMTIDASQNVGIGTSSPAEPLHISNSDARIRIQDSDGTNTYGEIRHTTGALYLSSRVNTNDGVIVFNRDNGTATTESMRIDSSGNVGIGGTTTTGWANKQVVLDGGSNTSVAYVMVNNTTGRSSTDGAVMTLSGSDFYLINRESANMIFRTANTERMRIDSSGNVGINKSNPSRTLDIEGASEPLGVKLTAGSNPVIRSEHYSTANANWYHIRFFTGGGAGGAILVNGSTGTVTYSTTSDYRLKNNLVEITDATSRLKQLNPVKFNWINAPDGQAVDGFLAHEVGDIVPEAIHGEKDAVDENGNIDPQGIDQAKLVPLLTKALQEAVAKIETLETTQADLLARIETLEGN